MNFTENLEENPRGLKCVIQEAGYPFFAPSLMNDLRTVIFQLRLGPAVAGQKTDRSRGVL